MINCSKLQQQTHNASYGATQQVQQFNCQKQGMTAGSCLQQQNYQFQQYSGTQPQQYTHQQQGGQQTGLQPQLHRQGSNASNQGLLQNPTLNGSHAGESFDPSLASSGGMYDMVSDTISQSLRGSGSSSDNTTQQTKDFGYYPNQTSTYGPVSCQTSRHQMPGQGFVRDQQASPRWTPYTSRPTIGHQQPSSTRQLSNAYDASPDVFQPIGE